MGISLSKKMEIKLSPNYLFQTLQKWELNLYNIIYNLNYIYIYIYISLLLVSCCWIKQANREWCCN